MTSEKLQQVISKMFESMSVQVPTYKDSPADWTSSEGNVAVCIIDDIGNVYGKIWGTNKIKGRRYYDIAYRKASQVWITGYKTMEYEKLVFGGQINHKDFGIELPDLMGWEGGQPIQLDAETRISCGFSGFKGVNDIAVVKKAAEEAMK
jgi:glc operon protein GlcG